MERDPNMARKSSERTGGNSGQKSSAPHLEDGLIGRASAAISRLFGRGRNETAPAYEPVRTTRTAAPEQQAPARSTRRPSDIGLDVLNRSYTPPATSGKAGFRSDGADHHSDQEFALGVSDERWNDEDRYTNKSGDPRIGTHGRTYEPGESRAGNSKE